MSSLSSFLTLPFVICCLLTSASDKVFYLGITFLFFLSLLPPGETRVLRSAWILLVGVVYFIDYQNLLLFYPALASAVVSAAFIYSEFNRPCLVLRMAKKIEPDLPTEAYSYCQKVNRVWVVLLLLNTSLAFLTAWQGNLLVWGWSNGFLSYLLFGSAMLAEYLCRRSFRARVEAKGI